MNALRLATKLSPYDLMEWGFLARALASPKFVRGIMCLANGLAACGKHEEAREYIARALAVNANFTPAHYAGYVRVVSGNDESARRLLAGLTKAGLLGG